PYADKVRRVLHLKDLAFETVEIPVSKPGKYKHIRPTGKFPAITHETRTVVDSSDICRYLETAFPTPRVAPDAPRDAANAAILEDWADEALYFYDLTMRNWPQNREWFLDDLLHFEKPGAMRNLLKALIPGALLKATKAQGLGRKTQSAIVADLAVQFDALETLLTDSDWLAGPRLSTADISVRVMVNVIERALEGSRLLGERPRLVEWASRVDLAAPPQGLSVTRKPGKGGGA
ncbi:MAG: glutathione S-transferase family protein, partial [Sandaracinobacteroides sp.]